MNNIDTEDGIRISQQFINLFVDECKSVEHNRDKDHDKNFTEKDHINTNDVGNKEAIAPISTLYRAYLKVNKS